MLIHRQNRMNLGASDASAAVKRRAMELVNKVKTISV
jgi:hypothetical protein